VVFFHAVVEERVHVFLFITRILVFVTGTSNDAWLPKATSTLLVLFSLKMQEKKIKK